MSVNASAPRLTRTGSPNRPARRHEPSDFGEHTELIGATDTRPMPDAGRDRLAVVCRETGTTTQLTVSGEWDLAGQQAVRDAGRAALVRGPECVVLDLSQLTFLDSSGVHAVLELHHRSAQQNTHLVIIPGPPAVQRPFDICQMTDRLPFLKTTG